MSVDDEPIYRLICGASGQELIVHGGRQALVTAFDRWQESGDTMGGRLLIEGVTDTADRAPVAHSVDVSCIQYMTLVRAY